MVVIALDVVGLNTRRSRAVLCLSPLLKIWSHALDQQSIAPVVEMHAIIHEKFTTDLTVGPQRKIVSINEAQMRLALDKVAYQLI